MRVLIFSSPFYPNFSGVPITSRLLARALVRGRHDVAVLTPTPLADRPELDEGYSVVRSRSQMRLLRESARSDLVVSKGGLSLSASGAALLTCTPLIVWHEMQGAAPHDLSGRRLLAGVLARYARVHVGVSHACVDSKPRAQRSRSVVIYNPVAPELYELKDAGGSTAFDLLFVGRLTIGKGILVLADALAILEAEGRAMRVRIVGDGTDRPKLMERLRRLSATYVQVTGVLTGADLASAYGAARAVVVPSTMPEGMGLVVAEALAFGCPVIASDQAVFREIVGNAGLLYRNGDARDLAAKIAHLMDDSTLRSQYAARGRMRADQMYSFSGFERRVQRLVDSVDRGAGGSG